MAAACGMEIVGSVKVSSGGGVTCGVSAGKAHAVAGCSLGFIHVLHTGKGTETASLKAAPRGMASLALSSDAGVVGAAGKDASLGMWDVASGRSLRSWPRTGAFASGLALNTDGSLLVASILRDVLIYDVRSSDPRPIQALQGPEGAVVDVGWVEEGPGIVAAAKDGCVWWWDIRSAQLAIDSLSVDNAPLLALGGDGRDGEVVVCSAEEAWVCRAEGGDVSGAIPLSGGAGVGGGVPTAVSFTPMEEMIAHAHGSDVCVMPTTTTTGMSGGGRQVLRGHSGNVTALTCAPSRAFQSTDAPVLLSFALDGCMNIWST